MIAAHRIACALALSWCSLAIGCAPRSSDRDDSMVTPSGDDDAESLGLRPTMDEGDPRPPGGGSATGPAIARPPATIYRQELRRATERGPAYVLRQLGPEPFRHHGTWVGWEITRLWPDDPTVCAPGCDVELGDVILSVNGSTLETPQAFAEALEALPKADRLVVHSLREGKRRERSYRIVDGAP
jgi:S1-C subfamily serine protease